MTTHHPIVIVGGGVSGLVAAALAARAGAPVVLLEKASSTGGRAATRDVHGFKFNLGPHALYREGIFRKTLQSLGIEPPGAVPSTNGGFAVYGGRLHTLPVGFTSLLTTGLLSLPAKLELAQLLATLGRVDASAIQGQPLGAWLDAHVKQPRVREVVTMLVRLTTFTNDPDRQSAGAAIEQLQLATKGNVLYLDGGWQTIVDGLRRDAVAHGVQIRTAASAVALESGPPLPAAGSSAPRSVAAVRLADGSSVRAAAVILGGAPADVDALAGTTFASTLPPSVRLASLDLALRALPRPKRLVAFGVDAPLYFSVHSAIARVAPDGGALVHVSKYLRPGESADREIERELERLADDMQPGWRDAIVSRQFLPNLTVTHAEVAADRGGLPGRPSSRLAFYDNVFVAGDWIGPRGQLSDAAAASASDAARLAVTSVAQPFRAASVA